MRLSLPFRAAQGQCRAAWLPLLLLSAACSSGSREPRQDENASAQQRQASLVRPAAPYPRINLPAALHLRRAAFSARFGRPLRLAAGFVDPGKDPDSYKVDSLVLFRPGGLPMIVSFLPAAGAVQDVLLLGPDEATLMRQATLVANAAGYLVLPVFEAQHTDRLLGLRVVPKRR